MLSVVAFCIRLVQLSARILLAKIPDRQSGENIFTQIDPAKIMRSNPFVQRRFFYVIGAVGKRQIFFHLSWNWCAEPFVKRNFSVFKQVFRIQNAFADQFAGTVNDEAGSLFFGIPFKYRFKQALYE